MCLQFFPLCHVLIYLWYEFAKISFFPLLSPFFVIFFILNRKINKYNLASLFTLSGNWYNMNWISFIIIWLNTLLSLVLTLPQPKALPLGYRMLPLRGDALQRPERAVIYHPRTTSEAFATIRNIRPEGAAPPYGKVYALTI